MDTTSELWGWFDGTFRAKKQLHGREHPGALLYRGSMARPGIRGIMAVKFKFKSDGLCFKVQNSGSMKGNLCC